MMTIFQQTTRIFGVLTGALVMVLLVTGCDLGQPSRPVADYGALNEQQQQRAKKRQMLVDQGYPPEEIENALASEFGESTIKFSDTAESNTEPPSRIDDLVFVKPSTSNPKGERVQFSDLLGKKNIVLVVTRGYSGGMICPFCAAQTAQLVAKHDEFVALDTEVLIVYPGETEHLKEFLFTATGDEQADIDAVKWSVLLDPDLSAVNLLDIAANLASPSTFLFDKQGDVAFAYVGEKASDRPSVERLLELVKGLE